MQRTLIMHALFEKLFHALKHMSPSVTLLFKASDLVTIC